MGYQLYFHDNNDGVYEDFLVHTGWWQVASLRLVNLSWFGLVTTTFDNTNQSTFFICPRAGRILIYLCGYVNCKDWWTVETFLMRLLMMERVEFYHR